MTKIEKKTYKDGMAYSLNTMIEWSYFSGYFTCALGGSAITFPTTVKDSADLNKLLSNPVVLTGIATLDDLAHKTIDPNTKVMFWKDYDWALGCSSGVKTRMTVSEVIQAIKIIFPQYAGLLPSMGQ